MIETFAKRLMNFLRSILLPVPNLTKIFYSKNLLIIVINIGPIKFFSFWIIWLSSFKMLPVKLMEIIKRGIISQIDRGIRKKSYELLTINLIARAQFYKNILQQNLWIFVIKVFLLWIISSSSFKMKLVKKMEIIKRGIINYWKVKLIETFAKSLTKFLRSFLLPGPNLTKTFYSKIYEFLL